MKKICLIFIFISVCAPAFSQRQQFSFQKIDSIAEVLSPLQSSTITELAEFINVHFNTDSGKSRFIYSWIATHIRYDVDCYLGKNSNQQDATTVFMFKQGVCSGYANLFAELCRHCNILCMRIDGTCNKNHISNHSWNAYKINDGWALADVTWAAGGVNDANDFIPQFSDQYFNVSPGLFIRDHFPDDPMWQLLLQPVTPSAFTANKILGDYQLQQGTFYFNDTIHHFLYLDSIHREEDSFRRSYAFNPGNKYLKEGRISTLMELSDQYLSVGDQYFNDYFKMKKNSFKQPGLFVQAEERIRTLLENANSYYQQIYQAYLTIPDSDDPYNKASIQNNREVINQRLYYLKVELEFMGDYFSASVSKRLEVLKSHPQMLQWW